MDILLNIWSLFEVQSLFKIILGLILSGIIGLERSSWNKPAGFRTHTLVGMSAVLIMICGEYMSRNYDVDPSRIPAQLLSGIGFIGAGTIMRDGFTVKGLTTAASLLAVTCVGLCIGTGFYVGAIVATILIYIVLSSSYKITDKLDHFETLEIKLKTNENSNILEKVNDLIDDKNIEIKTIKKSDEMDDNDNHDITIVLQYNKKDFTRNKIIKAFSELEEIKELITD